MCPVPGVVCTVVAVEEVVSGLLQDLYNLFGLCHVAAELLEVLAGHCALAPALGLGNDGVTQGDREIRAGLLLDGLYDLGSETQAVFQRAAVLVVAEVHVGNGKLVQVVAFVDSVDLNAVNTGLTQLLCGGAEVPDHLLDLLHGEGTGVQIVRPAVGGSGSGSAAVLHVDDGAGDLVQQIVSAQSGHPGSDGHGTAKAACQLNEQLAAGLVVLVHIGLELTVHASVLIQPLPSHGVADGLHAGQNQTHTILCSLEQEVRGLGVKMRGLQPAEQGCAAHGTLDNTVGNFYISDFERSK